MSNVKQQIDKLQADLDRLKEIVSNIDEPKFEVGKWYKTNSCLGSIFLLTELPKDNDYSCVKGFGFEKTILYNRAETPYWSLHKADNPTLATDEEVLTAFTNYFRSKGFVSGKSKFRIFNNGSVHTYKEPLAFDGKDIRSGALGYLFSAKTLTLATLIEEEKIMVGENEVVFTNGGAIINERWFSKKELKALLPLNPIFQKILDRLDK